MVFSGLLSSGDRPSSSRSKSSGVEAHDLQPEFIHDEAQLPLEALAAVFPDIQIEVFRELLSNFDGESRLALVADALLKNRVAWVKGRWRAIETNGQGQDGVQRADVFRSQEYIKAVRALAWQEFRGLPRATINAVLAESNHSYLDARRTLVSLSSKSWRFTISSLILRRKAVTGTGEDAAENHPLVVWRSTGQGSIVPTIRTTGNAELDRELYDALVRPLKERVRLDREARDRDLAVRLNNDEAEEVNATHECSCCFVTSTFEEFTSCSKSGHMICFRCVQHSIKEALFGQGWLSMNTETGTLKCLAVDGDGCTGHVPADHIHRALMDEKSGADLLHRLDQRLAEHSLVAAKVPLIHCPFCNYAEIDDIYMPTHETRLRISAANAYKLFILTTCAAFLILTMPFIFASTVICVVLSTNLTLWSGLTAEWQREPSRGTAAGVGACGSTARTPSARGRLASRATSRGRTFTSVKRVCPRCNTSFVKNAGCNKLTCPCGYKMCYVCRADLGDEGYRHFCDHFRPDGDPRPCRECDRCNLWESEDVEEVLREARDEAERRWKETEKRELSGQEKTYLETGVAASGSDRRVRRMLSGGHIPTLPDMLDFLVEVLFT
ncbi:hypothetical protein ACCO45_010992 [Purpureocillium lilacinum]|uniref:Uncharacterized protein n=1 Tax=Purpureocillium lilacinum TaxID=33203 RepID=A0ACC4DGK9_PURLI